MQLQCTIEEKIPTAQQWMSLRQSVGWATFPIEAARRSLEQTPFCVCAFAGDELVGMGRVLGDGVITFYVGNVMVKPEYQSAGVGGQIMERIMAYLRRSAVPGAIASLLSMQGVEDFYERYGFERRPDERHGSGMSLRF